MLLWRYSCLLEEIMVDLIPSRVVRRLVLDMAEDMESDVVGEVLVDSHALVGRSHDMVVLRQAKVAKHSLVLGLVNVRICRRAIDLGDRLHDVVLEYMDLAALAILSRLGLVLRGLSTLGTCP